MFTITCPNCKRGLRPPEERGDQRVTCPGCSVTFTVVCEGGFVRVVSTSVSNEELIEQAMPNLEIDDPPELLPTISTTVYEDEGARRTRRIHASFAIGFLGGLVFVVHKIRPDDDSPFGSGYLSHLPLILIVACMIGGCFAVLVGCVLTPKTETQKRGDAALRRMWTALEVDDPISRDHEPMAAPDPSQHVSTPHVQPKEPPA